MARNKFVSLIIASFLVSGCASKLSVQQNVNFNPGEKILKIAVLPFVTKSAGEAETATQVREEITANLQEGNYQIAEISEIDQKLQELNLTDPKELKKALTERRINWNEQLGVDAVVQGRIIEWSKTYLALHSDVELDVELVMFDAKKGTELAKIRKGVIKNSGITRLPTGYISAGTAPLLGLRKSVQQQVIHTLTREITQPLIALNSSEGSN